MARYLRLRSVADVERRLKNGRGQGHGADYLPWFYVHEVPSRGRSHKVVGLVNGGRTYHLLSDLEWYCLLALEFIRDVIDIREQFPLLPYGCSVPIARELGIRHPVYAKGVPKVLTSDFCANLPVATNSNEEVAIACKPKADLERPRTRELLTLECATNQALGRRWFLVTEDTIPRTLRRNLVWLWHGACLPESVAKSGDVRRFCDTFRHEHDFDSPLVDVLQACASAMRRDHDDCVWLFKYAVWHHMITVDCFEPIKLSSPIGLVEDIHDPSIIPLFA